jgi:D-glycero-alpha-D-manno-heptose-7-phosphate kinase
MIISKTPVRVSLGGGGTDLPSYYRTHGGGYVIAGAISRHVYIAVNQHFDEDILLKYSQLERVSDRKDIDHPLLREALTLTKIERQIEVSCMADVPAGIGLGSSGSFTVGVLKALHAYRRDVVSNVELAEEACHIEIERLGSTVGKQDQYIAAIGGVTAFGFRPDQEVDIRPVPMSEETRNRLEENLLLFFTGTRRSSSEVLTEQHSKSARQDRETAANLDRVKAIGLESFESLATGDLKRFSTLMTEQWELKRHRTPSATTAQIDAWIRRGLDAGAWGGKLVGAGGGGFLMFYSENTSDLRTAMREEGLAELRFSFDYEGARLVGA